MNAGQERISGTWIVRFSTRVVIAEVFGGGLRDWSLLEEEEEEALESVGKKRPLSGHLEGHIRGQEMYPTQPTTKARRLNNHQKT